MFARDAHIHISCYQCYLRCFALISVHSSNCILIKLIDNNIAQRAQIFGFGQHIADYFYIVYFVYLRNIFLFLVFKLLFFWGPHNKYHETLALINLIVPQLFHAKCFIKILHFLPLAFTIRFYVSGTRICAYNLKDDNASRIPYRRETVLSPAGPKITPP